MQALFEEIFIIFVSFQVNKNSMAWTGPGASLASPWPGPGGSGSTLTVDPGSGQIPLKGNQILEATTAADLA